MDDIFKSLEELPELLTCNDLVILGLFTSKNTAYLARKNGTGPDYIRTGTRKAILYPKGALIAFLKRNLQDGTKPLRNL